MPSMYKGVGRCTMIVYSAVFPGHYQFTFKFRKPFPTEAGTRAAMPDKIDAIMVLLVLYKWCKDVSHP